MQPETIMAEATQRSLLKLHRKRTTRWVIETSHLVSLTLDAIDANGLVDLRSQVQQIADDAIARPGSLAFGQLEYRYELDERDIPVKVHAFFIGQNGKRRRFMRLAKRS